uniref:DEF6 guanine nucleotide exchange factor n=1 Tax=Oncorhynchus mykiss TaxID=8022 RepID=A0A8K9XNH3_ONCMY
MELRAELLKSIWYAFTSLDVEKSGKVSKSQLKVLSHNLYTALNIPHDPVALEDHFSDDDDGDGNQVPGFGGGPTPAGESSGQPAQNGPGHCSCSKEAATCQHQRQTLEHPGEQTDTSLMDR